MRLLKIHPITGLIADNLSDDELKTMDPESIERFEEVKRQGGRLYWENINGTYHRVELDNVAFVAHMTGEPLEVVG